MDHLRKLNQDEQVLRLNQWLSSIDDLFVSIDLDGFDVAYAPGVSAINIGGLVPQDVFPLFHQLTQSDKLRLLDVAEMNPRFDLDGRTAKLGARCVWEICNRLVLRK